MTKIKIGICGTHGSGKTTKAKELEDHCAGIGKKVYVVHEVARSCPLPLGTIVAQEWIWQHQMAQERGAMHANVDVIICDRTVMDNLMYYYQILQWGYLDDHAKCHRWWQLYDEARAWMPTYDHVIRLPLNLEYLKADDPLRPKSEAYAWRIDALFDEFVQEYVTGEPL